MCFFFFFLVSARFRHQRMCYWFTGSFHLRVAIFLCIFSFMFYLLFSCSTTVCFEFGFPFFFLLLFFNVQLDFRFLYHFGRFCVRVGFVFILLRCAVPLPLSVWCTLCKLRYVSFVFSTSFLVAIQKGLGELLNSYQSSRLILVRLMILIGCQICGLCFPPHSRHETPIQWQARSGG